MWHKIKQILKKSPILVSIFHNVMMLKLYLQVNVESAKKLNSMPKDEIEKLRGLKDIYKGERCFIVGTGPSLTIEALEKIADEKSFAVNSAYMAYEYTRWRPNFYMIADDSAFKVLGKGCYTDCRYDYFFLGTTCEDKIPNCVNVCINSSNHFLINTIWNRLFKKVFPIARYSKDITKVIYGGKTVIYPAIQIAAYMGFKEIYLLGVDCNYKKRLSHADFVEGEKDYIYTDQWAVTTSEMMIMQFEEMSKLLPADVRVYNLSTEGNLDAFPRRIITDIIM